MMQKEIVPLSTLEKLNQIQRNQQQIDSLTRTNTLLLQGVLLETTVSNLSRLPGLPANIRSVLDGALNGAPYIPAHEVPIVSATQNQHLLPGANESSQDLGHNKKPGPRKGTKRKSAAKKTATRTFPDAIPPAPASGDNKGIIPNQVSLQEAGHRPQVAAALPHEQQRTMLRFAENNNGVLNILAFTNEYLPRRVFNPSFFKTTIYSKAKELEGMKLIKKTNPGEYKLLKPNALALFNKAKQSQQKH